MLHSVMSAISFTRLSAVAEDILKQNSKFLINMKKMTKSTTRKTCAVENVITNNNHNKEFQIRTSIY